MFGPDDDLHEISANGYLNIPIMRLSTVYTNSQQQELTMSYRVSSPFGAFTQLNRELNRFFDTRSLDGQLVESASWTPQVDIVETEASFLVIADLPGVDPAAIELNLDQGVLTIQGERGTTADREGSYSRRERKRGSFLRRFNLPESADAAAISAKSSHGVLEITIPKSKPAQPVSITVTGE